MLMGTPGGYVSSEYRLRFSGARAAAIRRAGGGTVRIRLRSSVGAGSGALSPRAYRASTTVRRLAPAGRWRRSMPAAPAPRCERQRFSVTHSRTARLVVRCANASTVSLAEKNDNVTSQRSSMGRLIVEYRAPARGTDRIMVKAASASGSVTVENPVTMREPLLRAIGDSITAGYAFFGDGSPMYITQLLDCTPDGLDNDRCSSNSSNGVGSKAPLSFLPDYGLANQVAYPAQLAQGLGLTDKGQFENLAISGATPSDFDKGGKYSQYTSQVASDNPDIAVMMLGGNPLLHEFIFGSAYHCEFTLSDSAFKSCVDAAIAAADLPEHFAGIFDALLQAPATTVIVPNYPFGLPASAFFGIDRVEYVLGAFQAAVKGAVTGYQAKTGTSRVVYMDAPSATLGLPPGSTTCPSISRSSKVDGASDQSTVTQVKLGLLHPFTFCPGADQWFVSSETGAHLSRFGHMQYAMALSKLIRLDNLIPEDVVVAPANTEPPAIYGELKVGSTVGVTDGLWQNVPTGFSYSWQRCATSDAASCTAIDGQTSDSYSVQQADDGKYLRATVTATNAAGSTAASSGPAAVPGPSPTPMPMPDPNPGPAPEPTPSNQFTSTPPKAEVFRSKILLTTEVSVPDMGVVSVVARSRVDGRLSTRCDVDRVARQQTKLTVTCRMGSRTRERLRRSALRLDLRTGFSPVGGTPNSRSTTLVIPRR